MSGLQRAIESLQRPGGKIAASKVVTISPDFFAETWTNRPVADIDVGIRVPSEKDVQTARSEAAKTAGNLDDDASDAEKITVFNDVLMACAVASGICDPFDVCSPHPFFELADDMVPAALTTMAIKYLYDSIEQLHVERSPAFQEITEEQTVKLVSYLCEEDPYQRVDRVSAMKARRYLKLALDTLEE